MFENKNLNIFAALSRENLKKIRESIIGMVLATDMAGHFTEINKLKSRLGSSIYYYYYFIIIKLINLF